MVENDGIEHLHASLRNMLETAFGPSILKTVYADKKICTLFAIVYEEESRPIKQHYKFLVTPDNYKAIFDIK